MGSMIRALAVPAIIVGGSHLFAQSETAQTLDKKVLTGAFPICSR